MKQNKFNIGDTVYYLDDTKTKLHQLTIVGVQYFSHLNLYSYYFKEDIQSIDEHKLSKSPKELIDNAITNLLMTMAFARRKGWIKDD